MISPPSDMLYTNWGKTVPKRRRQPWPQTRPRQGQYFQRLSGTRPQKTPCTKYGLGDSLHTWMIVVFIRSVLDSAVSPVKSVPAKDGR